MPTTLPKLLYVQSEIRSMRHELVTLQRTSELTSGEVACFEAALTALERRARRLLAAAGGRSH